MNFLNEINALLLQEWFLIIIRAIVVIVTALFSYFILPYIKTMVAYDYVVKMVQAAEKLLGSGTGEEKKEKVTEWVSTYCQKYHINLTKEQISLLIESACLTLEQVKKHD